MVAHNLDEEFVVTCLHWIAGYVRLEPGTKSASLETDVFAQQYALIVMHATVVIAGFCFHVIFDDNNK